MEWFQQQMTNAFWLIMFICLCWIMSFRNIGKFFASAEKDKRK